MTPPIQLIAVCTGTAQPLPMGTRRVLSGIRKQAVPGPVHAAPLGLAGDEQADLSLHGGLDKAVYAYPAEHLPRWQQARVQAGVPGAENEPPLPPGFLGENLRIRGLLESEAWVGDTLHFEGSDCVLRITAPRQPCDKFNAVMGFNRAARLMAQEAICGFYLAVETPGPLAAGMTARLHPGPRGLSIDQAMRAKWAKYSRD